MAQPISVLLIVYQCAPEGGSVSMIGYRWAKHLSSRCKVSLITHIRHRAALEGCLPEGVEALYVDTERFAAPLYKLVKRLFPRSQHLQFALGGLDFLLFPFFARKLCRKRTGEWDVCHVATPVSPSAPHRLHRIGLPTLLGPLNGGMTTPSGFPEIAAVEGVWVHHLRKILNAVRFIMGTLRHARLIFSAGTLTDAALGKAGRRKIKRMCENGIDQPDNSLHPFPETGNLELVFVGRVIALKGLDMLLEAMVLAERPIRLTIIGDGPERAALTRLATSLDLEDQVRFLGFLQHSQLAAHYRRAHVNLLPCIRESGGATILEAMAHGRPSIALDHGGPADYIKPEWGFLLPCHNRNQVIEDLARLLARLNLEDLEPMGHACLAEACNYTWEAKIDTAVACYKDVLGAAHG